MQMIAASQPTQRPPGAKLLIVDRCGAIAHATRSGFARFVRPGDLVIANDAATLPASLQATHLPTGDPIEVRLAGRRSLAIEDILEFSAIVFGAGDFHTPTEDRPAPPALEPGDHLKLGSLSAMIQDVIGHPRMIHLRFEGTPDAIWAGIARHGRPIQYAHVPVPLALWDVWSPISGLPVAFEPPSAGFALDWRTLADIRARGARFATITHAAGISSTGDAELDRLLPLDEPYRIPGSTAESIALARRRGGRIIAIGTTVVRALEHAAGDNGLVRAGEGLAIGRIGPATRLQVVDMIFSGTHQAGTSHYELLRAFTDDGTLGRASQEMEARNYRTHEFGDSVFIERKEPSMCKQVGRLEG
jgi:S-adenosylmethionine:tRNA ribosyltransferase-isomerase